jgi:nicotinamidase-related amidase
MITLSAATTALILLDLQKGAFAPDFSDALKAPVDRPLVKAPPGGFPEDWFELADGLAEASDLKVTKRQWGAFYGTDLDLRLRRRGVTTVVIGGVATNMAVESTARAAHEHEHGYAVVLPEDAATTFSAKMHAFAFEHIFPHLGRVAKADEIEL